MRETMNPAGGNPGYMGHAAGPAAAQGAPATMSTAAGAAPRPNLQRMSPQEQRQALLELVREGHNDEEIGDLFGLSQWQVRNLRYRLGIKKDRGGNVHLEPMRLRQTITTVEAEAGVLAGEDGRPRLALTLEGEFDGTTLANYLEGITSFVSAAGSRPFRVRCYVSEAGEDQ